MMGKIKHALLCLGWLAIAGAAGAQDQGLNSLLNDITGGIEQSVADTSGTLLGGADGLVGVDLTAPLAGLPDGAIGDGGLSAIGNGSQLEELLQQLQRPAAGRPLELPGLDGLATAVGTLGLHESATRAPLPGLDALPVAIVTDEAQAGLPGLQTLPVPGLDALPIPVR